MYNYKIPLTAASASGNYTLRVQFPMDVSPSPRVLLTRSAQLNNRTTPKLLHTKNECHICRRHLYSFEEVLLCRLCHGSYHWRCLKPETISYYGDNTHFICEKCNDSVTNTSRITNASGIKIKSVNSSETDYRDFANIPTKFAQLQANKDTNVVQTIRHFEQKQQTKSNGLSMSNDNEMIEPVVINGQYHPEEESTPRRTKMFQANYHYTPLKDYAAMRNTRLTSNEITHHPTYQNSALAAAEKDRRYETNHRPVQHYVSTTNLNINENRLSNDESTTSLGGIPSRPSTDSGIVILNHQQQSIEKKLTDLVQQLGRQIESDSQKLNDKLELKLNHLEKMIHQQTFIIQRQDEVIERLKTKILHIESERDQMRQQLISHEKDRQRTESITNTNSERKNSQTGEILPERKSSQSSSIITEPSRTSTRKSHIDLQERHSTIGELMRSIPLNQERSLSDSSAADTATAALASAVPLLDSETPKNRLDDIIRQPTSSTVYQNLNSLETNLVRTGETVPTIHQESLIKPGEIRSNRSNSVSSASSASVHVDHTTFPTRDQTRASDRQSSNIHRSLEALPQPRSENEPTPSRLSNKTQSLDLHKKTPIYEESGPIYVTPPETAHAASQYTNTMKGWLRKQTRGSFLGRIERYYCVISANQLLMHRQEADQKAHKAVDLTTARIGSHEDPRHGRTIDLSWTNRYKDAKHYLLYFENTLEADRWFNALKTTIENIGETPVQLQRFQS